MMRIRTLSDTGLQVFEGWLRNPVGPAPRNALTDPGLSAELNIGGEVDVGRSFSTSFELGEYLNNKVFAGAFDRLALNREAGMWAWLSLAFMDSLVRHQGKSKGAPLAIPHYIDTGPRLAYRLITRTAWNLVNIHGEAAKVALLSRRTPWGEMAEQMTSSQEVFANASVWQVAYKLYLDDGGEVRRGATSKRTKQARRDPKSTLGLGGVRRLPQSFKQFDRTYNTREMSAAEILELLPGEYSRWAAKHIPEPAGLATA